MSRLATKSKKFWFVVSVLCFAMLLAFGLSTKKLSAHLHHIETEAYVEIDGVGYGIFNQISNLRDLTQLDRSPTAPFTKISLKRDFVTDPSLSLWARKSFHVGDGLKDIRLVIRTKEGQEVSRYTLRYCKPLSWTVEAADPSQGGFHEKIELAVQEIAVY